MSVIGCKSYIIIVKAEDSDDQVSFLIAYGSSVLISFLQEEFCIHIF
jgi:hypothetical protein